MPRSLLHSSYTGLLLAMFSHSALATRDLNQVMDTMMEPLRGLTGFVLFVCYAAGVALVIGSVMQYRIHRRTPKQVPLTTPFFYLFFGLMLLIFPYFTTLAPTANLLSQVPTPIGTQFVDSTVQSSGSAAAPHPAPSFSSSAKEGWYRQVDPANPDDLSSEDEAGWSQ